MAAAATNAKALNFSPGSRVPSCEGAECESPSHPRNMHDFGDFTPGAGDLEMRMILAEQLCRGFCIFGLHDRVAPDPVLGVGSTFGVDSLGLAQRRPAIDERRLMVAHPFHPPLHALLLLFGSGLLHHPLKVGGIGHVQDHELFHWLILPLKRTNAISA